MKFKLLYIIVVGAFLSPFFKLYAQPTEPTHEDDFHVSVAPEDSSQGVTKEELARLMDEAHEALESGEKHEAHDHHHEHCPNCGSAHHSVEHGHSHGFSLKALFSLESWKEKFNFKQTILNALRWYQITATNDEIKTHVANIITMLVASHYSEGVIGVQIAKAGLAFDNIAANILGVGLGSAIVVPGLDPLCIFLVWTYKKIPHLMGKMMFVPRIIIVKGSGILYRSLGAHALMRSLFYKQNALDRLEAILNKKEGGAEIFRLDSSNLNYSVKYQGKDLLLLSGKIEGQRIAWEQLLVSKDLKDPEVLAHLKKELRPLDWLLRQSIYDVIKRIENTRSIARLSYIETASESGDMIDVRMRTRGMASLPATRFIGAKNCLYKLFLALP